MNARRAKRARRLVEAIERKIGELKRINFRIEALAEDLRKAHMRAPVWDEERGRDAWESVADAYENMGKAIDGLALVSCRVTDAANGVPS